VGTSCNDAVFCDGADSCDGAGNCSHHAGDPCLGGAECNRHCNEAAATCFNPAATPCTDDQQLCTTDACNGVGACAHADLLPKECPKGYALLACRDATHARGRGTLGWRNEVGGDACGDIFETVQWSRIKGNVVSSQTGGLAVRFRRRYASVDGDVVTGGGTVAGLSNAQISGRVDTSGTGVEVGECASACAKEQARRATLASLAATTTSAAPVIVPQRGHRDIVLGSGQQVLDIPEIRVKARGTLRLVGNPSTGPVIIRVHGLMRVGYQGHVDVQGLQPEQVLIVAGKDIIARAYSHLTGTLVSGGTIRFGRMASIDGQVVGPLDFLGALTTVNFHPFEAW